MDRVTLTCRKSFSEPDTFRVSDPLFNTRYIRTSELVAERLSAFFLMGAIGKDMTGQPYEWHMPRQDRNEQQW